MKNDPINAAVEFLIKRGYTVPLEVLALKSNKTISEMLLIKEAIKKMAMKAGGDYASIRAKFWDDVYENVYQFLDSNRQIQTFNRPLSAALSNAYIVASETAWVDGGGTLPLDDDTLEWAKAELSAQLAYLDSLFISLNKLRKEKDVNKIYEAFQRADGYASALDAFYNYIKTAAYGGKMLTFAGSDGRESCIDCRRLKGQRKRASWWVSNDFVPPSRKFECGGYNCDHFLIDDKGNIFTV